MEPPKESTSRISIPAYVEAPSPKVVTTQPTMVIKPQPVHKDYLAWSIVNLICCCLPLGIAALVFSIKTRDLVHRQDLQAASRRSRTAFTCNVVATVLGLCIHSIWIAGFVHFCVTGGYSSYYYG